MVWLRGEQIALLAMMPVEIERVYREAGSPCGEGQEDKFLCYLESRGELKEVWKNSIENCKRIIRDAVPNARFE